MEKKFDDGDLTVIAKEQTYLIDYNAEDIFDRGVTYLEEMAETKYFLDALKKYIQIKIKKLDFVGNIDNVDDIFAFVKQCYKKAGMVGDKGKEKNSYNSSLVKSWINGKPIKDREEAYRFCFCLNMDTVETMEFLFKGCLMKPFNFKDISECVYYFCLNSGYNYMDAVRIIEEINSVPDTGNPFPENDTITIGEKIQEINTKDEFISYINNNKNGFKEQSRKAIDTLKEQIERSVELAEWERVNDFADYSISQIDSPEDIPAILNVILGYEARANAKGIDVYKKKIKKSNFPELIKNNFPQPPQLKAIFKSGVPSVDTLRKAIILFVFYNMFAEIKKLKKEGKIKNYSGGIWFDEFAAELDSVLSECGYIQMYWRHPYDWMFGYCAGADEPLDELRELISYFYLEEEDAYSDGNKILQEEK